MDKQRLSQEAHENAVEHGFKFDDVNYNLVKAYGELAEGLEHIEQFGDGAWYPSLGKLTVWMESQTEIDDDMYERYLEKKVEMEIADCYVRLLSMCGAEVSEAELNVLVTGVANEIVKASSYTDLMQACGERIFGSSGFTPILYGVCEGLEQWCEKNDIDLAWFVKVKMNYNKNRPYLHLEEK